VGVQTDREKGDLISLVTKIREAYIDGEIARLSHTGRNSDRCTDRETDGTEISQVSFNSFHNKEIRLMKSPCCLCVCILIPPIVSRQWLAKHVSVATNNYARI
jgi:hypothetical protein